MVMMEEFDQSTDPVEDARTAVAQANQIVSDLVSKQSAVTAEQDKLRAERRAISFQAMVDAHKPSLQRLEELKKELQCVDGDAEALQSALDTAKNNVVQVQRQLERARRQQTAAETLDKLELLTQHAASFDLGLKQLTEAWVAIDKLCHSIAGVTNGRPSRAIVANSARRAVHTWLTPFSNVFSTPVTVPAERKKMAEFAQAWIASLAGTLQREIDNVDRTAADTEQAA